MDQNQIKNALLVIIRPYLNAGNSKVIDPQSLRGDENLRNDLNVDSADMVEIVLDIESEFRIEIEDAAIEKISTLNDVIALVNEKVSLKAG